MMRKHITKFAMKNILRSTDRIFSYKVMRRPAASELKMPSTVTGKAAPSIQDIVEEKIKLNGPITVADYMKIVVTNPSGGYYMKKEAIGAGGDFVTSPEISQLFGEILGIWFVVESQKMGSPKPIQIVELGPGNGTLMLDMMRAINQLGYKAADASLHLVEISPTLQHLQASRLCMVHHSANQDGPHYHEGETLGGMKVYWYRDLKHVPAAFSWYVAHEFFDALPVHKFQKFKAGWREILIDMDLSTKTLSFKIASDATAASQLLVRAPLDSRAEHLEISPQALGLARQLATRVEEDGGVALIADYGHEGEKGDTFRAFKKHQLADPLVDPGSSDLTADVDFQQLRLAGDTALVTTTVTQRDFLHNSHAQDRLKILLENANEDDQKSLQSGFNMLTDPTQMGERFKFMAFYPTSMTDILNKYPPLGFARIDNKASNEKGEEDNN